MNIIPIIRELILRNQKAVIPGFGNLVISQRPAQLNRITKELAPPTRELSFKQTRQTDNAQLILYLGHKTRQKPEAVNEAVSAFMKSAGEQLAGNGSFVLEGLGKLIQTGSGEFKFEADDELTKQINLFDLPKLNVQPVHQESRVEPKPAPKPVHQPAPAAEKVFPVIYSKKKRRWWIPAALAGMVLGLAAYAYFTGFYERFLTGRKVEVLISENNQQDERLVFGSRTNADSIANADDSLKAMISQQIDEQTTRERALNYEESKAEKQLPVEPEPKQVSTPEPAIPVSSSPDKPFHVIAGSFTIVENAERQMARLRKKGFSPAMLPKRGKYYMVSMGSYNTGEQATAAKKQFKEQLDQELWVMERR
ncbi:MAG: SPOR domain-containing protein [Bacteroidales bacterium]|nr:SPOR domain-containing protein [Bacteroidales bacterium]